jgi:hypothetical protein
MMEAERTSETLLNFYQTAWRYNPEDSHLCTHRCENLKSFLCISLTFIEDCHGRLLLLKCIRSEGDNPKGIV